MTSAEEGQETAVGLLSQRLIQNLQKLTGLSQRIHQLQKVTKVKFSRSSADTGGAVEDGTLQPKKRKLEQHRNARELLAIYSRPSKYIQETVLDFYVRRYTYHSAEEWKQRILDGQVFVNGIQASPDLILRAHDRVLFQVVDKEPDIDRAYELVYQDVELVVVCKSGNIPVSPCGRYLSHTLHNIVTEDLKAQTSVSSTSSTTTLYQVHRLDKETSGVVVFTRTEQACVKLCESFKIHDVFKRYTAILLGEMTKPMVCDLPIATFSEVCDEVTRAQMPEEVRKIRMCTHPSGKPASTRFEPIRVGQGLTLCQIFPVSGRTHQIRVHALHLGFPVLGDKLYGKSDREFLALSKEEILPQFEPFGVISRQLLHCTEMIFPHPVSGGRTRVYSSSVRWFSQFDKVKFLFDNVPENIIV